MHFPLLKSSVLPLAIASLCGLALIVSSANASPNNAENPTRQASVLPSGLRSALYKALAEDLNGTYRIGENGCATSPNANLKACFDRQGAHFAGAGTLALHLAAYGRGEKLTTVKPVKPVIEGNQASYVHGTLTEWWKALPMGFEQGFTLTKRPAGQGKLTLTLSTNRQDTDDSQGNTLAWGKLRYGKLVAIDATGRIISSSLKRKGGRILIAISDTNAVYPVTIDPLVWIKRKVSDVKGLSKGALLSGAVAIEGNTALVGAPGASTNGVLSGAVYVFTRSNGTWEQSARLTGAIGGFGAAVALYGSTALIGAPESGIGANSNRGAVYVYTRSNGDWTQTQTLVGSNSKGNDEFGSSIALGDGVALIGAPFRAPGAVYVFTESNGMWTQATELTVTGGGSGDGFGTSVAIDGHTALIGAPRATVGSHYFQGVAYIFSESKGVWAEDQTLSASEDPDVMRFGASVALDGLTAMIGAPQANADKPQQGAVFVFHNSAGAWNLTQKFSANDGIIFGDFGSSIALQGKVAVIASPGINNSGQGVAYLFSNSGGAWKQTRELPVSNGNSNTFYWGSVALSATADTVVVTAPDGDNSGAIYFFDEATLDLAAIAPQAVDKGQVYVSQTILTNTSSVASPAVAVTVAVPAAATFVSATATQGSCTNSSGVIRCDFGTISGNAGMATANIKMQATGAVGDTIESKASVVRATPSLSASVTTTIAVNNPPVASDGTLTTDENVSASDTLEATDSDGDPLAFSIVSQPGHGSVTLDDPSTGAYTYTPDQDYSGNDSFTFKANDGQADSNTAKITITVKAVNHPPVASSGTLTTAEDVSANGRLEASDPDGDPLTFSIVDQAGHGRVMLDDASTGAYTYTPDQGFSGSDIFTFKAIDGQVDSNTAKISITVKAAPPPPSPGPPPGGGSGATGPLGLFFLVFAALFAYLRRMRRD